MKTVKITLALITAALLPLALLASPSSAAIGVDDQPVSGSLNPWNTATSSPISPAPTSFETGQVIRLQANLPTASAGRSVKLYKVGSGTAVATATANSSGNAYFNYEVVEGVQNLFAEDSSDLETETDEYTGTPTPQSTTAVLDAPTNGGKTWTAHFGSPAVPGKATQLQIQRIYTDEVGDVDAVNPGDSKTKRMGEWKTIASSTQNASGDTTFNIASPYPYRVAHKYRAVSGTAKSCEPVYATDAVCQTFGLPQTTPQNTGLSAVYFNSNEGHAIDSRTRYYEGEFEMTADSRGLGCSAVPKMKFSIMKGRGNYSWTFKRKSYSLKLGNKTDLCGMGESKKYALVSQDYDKSFSRNALAQYIGDKFDNMAFTPESRPVDLYLNGKYLGNYMLVERIAIESVRVDIDELKGGEDCQGVETPDNQTTDANHPNNVDPCVTGGYILEWDFRKGADRNVTAGSSGWVGIKDPEDDRNREGQLTEAGISTQQKNYIDDYLGKADSALKNAGSSNSWKNYIDEASAVDYFIAMEFMKPVDGNMWASVYMYKPRNGKLFLGPMWDFDLAAGSATRAGNVASTSGFYLKNNINISAKQISSTYPTWFNRLNQNSSFRSAVAARWDEVKDTFNIEEFMNDQRAAIETSANRSFQLAPNGASHSYRISQYQVIKGSSWSSDWSHLKSWAKTRKSWLDGSSGF